MNIYQGLQAPFFAGTINYRFYQSTVNPKTRNAVLMLHGQGECGPSDGSLIHLVERNEGFPKFARGIRPNESQPTGFCEYPWHVFAPQVAGPTSYSTGFLKTIVGWLCYEHHIENLVVAGLSMGCYGAYDILKYDRGERVRGIIAICGSNNVSEIPFMRPVRGLAWHSTDDPRVVYAPHKKFVDEYNLIMGSEGGHIKFNTLTGYGHNAWNPAFSTDMAADENVKLINEIFAEYETGNEFERGFNMAKSLVSNYVSNLVAG